MWRGVCGVVWCVVRGVVCGVDYTTRGVSTRGVTTRGVTTWCGA